jgi:hypothetical protein
MDHESRSLALPQQPGAAVAGPRSVYKIPKTRPTKILYWTYIGLPSATPAAPTEDPKNPDPGVM